MPSTGEERGADERSIDPDSGTARRNLLKTAAAGLSAGALGSLSGCAGGGGGDTPTPKRIVQTKVVKQTVKGEEKTVVKTKVVERTVTAEGASEDQVVSFWSAHAVETPALTSYYREQMREFEKIHNNEIIVNLQGLSYGNLKTKYATTVSAGAGIPDYAESGTFGLEQWHNGNVLETGKFIEQTEGLPDNWADAQVQAGQYRDTWWSAGNFSLGSNSFAILNEPFKQVGIKDPFKEMKTWSGTRNAFDKVQNQKPGNVQFAHEVTGTTFDVEQYWGKARTSYKKGVDPWIDVTEKGSFDSPYIKVDGNPRTDGMILNNIDLGNKYSSPDHPTRGDEQCYPLMVQGTLASQMYGSGVRSFKTQNPDITFGWPDGDITALPLPKLNKGYGKEFGVKPLEGVEGAHGAHVWSLESQQTIQKASQNPDDAWSLATFVNTDRRFLIPMLVDPGLSQGTPMYTPIIDIQQQSKFKDMRTQPFEQGLKNLKKYGSNYQTTGAKWDIPGTNNIRWKDLGTTLSKAYAGEFAREEAPTKVKQAIVKTLQDNDLTAKNA